MSAGFPAAYRSGKLEHLAQGDDDAFWRLWALHQRRLFEICLRLMRGNQADAEDALGSAALKALNKTRAHAGHITDLRPWLSRLIYNHCLDLHRERRRRRRAENAQITMAIDPGISTSIPSSPEHNLWSNEITRFTEITVNNLPRHLREPFRMRIIDELSYQEITAVLALSPENVRKRIRLAREALR